MHFRRFVGLLVALALIMTFSGAEWVAAQDDGTRRIPVWGEFIRTELSPDGATLAVFEIGAGHGNEVQDRYLPIHLVDLVSGAEVLLEGQTDYVSSLAFTPDGTRLVSTHDNGEMLVWDLATYELLDRYPMLPGRDGRLIILPDNNTAVVAVGGSAIAYALWDISTGAVTRFLVPHYETYLQFSELAPYPNQEIVFNVSPDGTRMVAASTTGNVSVWNLEAGTTSILVPTSQDPPLPNFYVRLTSYVLDGAAIAVHDQNTAELTLVDPANGSVINSFPAETKGTPSVSPDGTLIAWITPDEMIVVADLASGDVLTEFAAPVDESLKLRPFAIEGSMHFLPDNSQLVISGYIAESPVNAVWVVDLDLP